MKQISKITEPQSLVRHRANQPANYAGLPLQAKDDLRENLLTEQGHICCYCMKRIPESTAPLMKVEHFKCQVNYGHLDLSYPNLLGACTGNEGQPIKIQTCDTKKANVDFSLHPCTALPSCDSVFKYTADGRIFCDNDNLQDEIDTTLNLNSQSLQDLRAEVYDHISTIVQVESKNQKDKKLRIKYFESLRQEWSTPDKKGKLRPFCMVAIYYLTKKINQNQI